MGAKSEMEGGQMIANRISSVVVPLLVLGCVTINVYFPEQEVKDFSQAIEEEVRRQAEGSGEEQQPPSGGAEQRDDQDRRGAVSSAFRSQPEALRPAASMPWISRLMGVSTAYAQQSSIPEPEITNPAIRKIIASRAQRLEALNRYKAQGVVGENNAALVEVRDLQAIADLRERAEVQRLVREENADREQLYKEVALAKGVDAAQLPLIRKTYAETLRQLARPGEWIQREDGQWVRK